MLAHHVTKYLRNVRFQYSISFQGYIMQWMVYLICLVDELKCEREKERKNIFFFVAAITRNEMIECFEANQHHFYMMLVLNWMKRLKLFGRDF